MVVSHLLVNFSSKFFQFSFKTLLKSVLHCQGQYLQVLMQVFLQHKKTELCKCTTPFDSLRL